MKKVFLLCVGLLLFSGTASAQWEFGAKAGIGYASITDDLSTKSPIFGATVGGYANITFVQSKSMLAEIFYMQTGLNLNRRGSNYQVVLERDNTLSIRKGYYHAYYAQIPFLFCVHMELPIRKAGHIVGVYLGPAFSIGLFGRCKDRLVSPGISSYTGNYDIDIHGTAHDRAVFSHLKRFDLSGIVGLSYEYKQWVMNLYVDYGFLPTSNETDIIRVIENSNSGNNSNVRVDIPNGYNTAYMLSIGYKLK